jgi:predicted nuclease of predicted toxin-antitoxin system
MRLLLDENAGHDVVRSIDALGGAATDSAVLAYAKKQDRVVVSYNAVDFIALAVADDKHRGVLLLYRGDLPSDLGFNDIVSAIGNVEKTYGNSVDGLVLTLNQFRW